MHTSFTIESVTVAGHPTRRDSTVSFRSGLNVIYGPSNTGKSQILQCIDYMFGADVRDFAFKESDGYTHVDMVVKTNGGALMLSRPIGANHNDVTVDSSDQNIQSGTYKCASTKNRPMLSHLWLKLIGFDNPDEAKAIKNKDFLGVALTWRSFSHVLFGNESSIIKESSILLPTQKTAETTFKSSMAVLITGKDFSAEAVDRSSNDRKQDNAAVIAFLESQPENIKARLETIDMMIGHGSQCDLREQIDALSDEATAAQQALQNAVMKGRDVAGQLQEIRERIAEANMLSQRYRELASSYMARLERFDFVMEGHGLINHYPVPMLCPVCDQALPLDRQIEVVHPSQEERDLLQTKLESLRQTMDELDEEKRRCDEQETELAERSDAIDALINGELLPRFRGLKDKIEDHNALVALQVEREQLVEQLKTVREELERRMAMTFPKGRFDALDYYPADFWDDMSQRLLDTLGACAFPNLIEARFDRTTFDAVINGVDKHKEGKGYRAFVNIAVLLSLHDYLASDRSAHNPGFLMIDTPLLGFDDPQLDPESRKLLDIIPTALYEYLVSKEECGQLIVVDNTKFMPNLDGLKGRCNIVRFTKQKNDGRYGFLLDMYDGDATDVVDNEWMQSDE